MVTTRSSGAQPNGTNSGLAEKSRVKKRTNEATEPANGAAKRPKLRAKTDRSRWRMRNEDGVQTWHYLEDDEAAKDWPQTYPDKYYLGLPLVSA
jgi:lanosterol synthase